MSGVRGCRGKVLVHFEPPPPILQPQLLGGDEILVGDRPDPACPKAAGAAEIRNAGFRRNARPGQRDDAFGAREKAAQRLDFLVEFSVRDHMLSRETRSVTCDTCTPWS